MTSRVQTSKVELRRLLHSVATYSVAVAPEIGYEPPPGRSESPPLRPRSFRRFSPAGVATNLFILDGLMQTRSPARNSIPTFGNCHETLRRFVGTRFRDRRIGRRR